MTSRAFNPSQSGSAVVSDPVKKRQHQVSQLSVLVADDTPAYQKYIKQILQDRGHLVTHVGDGGEATESYQTQRFDVIIADVQMPVMDGFALARWIRGQEKNSNRHTPIIALTAHGVSDVRTEGMSAGIDAYLTKPIDAQQLVAAVEEWGFSRKGQSMKTTQVIGRGDSASADSNRSSNSESGPIVDFEGAMIRLGGDRVLFREFIGVYDEDKPTLMETLHAALKSRDASTLERSAHGLRGLISNFGARRAVEVASQMEDVAKNSRWPDGADTMAKLDQEIELLSEALEAYRR